MRQTGAKGEVNSGAMQAISCRKGCRFDAGPGTSLNCREFKAQFYPINGNEYSPNTLL